MYAEHRVYWHINKCFIRIECDPEIENVSTVESIVWWQPAICDDGFIVASAYTCVYFQRISYDDGNGDDHRHRTQCDTALETNSVIENLCQNNVRPTHTQMMAMMMMMIAHV